VGRGYRPDQRAAAQTVSVMREHRAFKLDSRDVRDGGFRQLPPAGGLHADWFGSAVNRLPAGGTMALVAEIVGHIDLVHVHVRETWM
jgi:hypothetical protein